MRGITSWQFRPYVRPFEPEKALRPYVCQIVPQKCGFAYGWIDNSTDRIVHTLYYRPRGQGEYTPIAVKGYQGVVGNLENYTDYEFYIERTDGEKSAVRIVRTGDAPPDCSVVNYLHPEDNVYDFTGHALCAPSLVKLPSGKILVMLDVQCDRTKNPADPCLSILMQSLDNGKTWQYVNELLPSFSSQIFYHNGRLYCLTLRTDFSDMIIGCSDDEGVTWTPPVTILRGEGVRRYGWQRGSYPIVQKDGRLFTGVEYGHVTEIFNPTAEELATCTPIEADPRESAYRNAFSFVPAKMYDLANYVGVLSIPTDADMMVPANWSVTPLYYPYDYDPRQCVEGNVVLGPDGQLYDMLRTIRDGKSLLMKLDPENEAEGALTVVKLVDDFPLSAVSKFVIKQDNETQKFIAFGNLNTTGRKVLAMAVSDDFKAWRVAHIVADGTKTNSAFSYPDWQFDGDNIILVSRTAWNGAADHHDTNTITFHTISNFRALL